jgi:hypothetical protein
VITKNCVFVIGAGASQVYGLPSGADLKDRVLNLLANPDEIFSKVFRSNQIETFRESLFRSGCNSVDAFLENRSDFADIGKFAISEIIAKQEIVGRLFDSGKTGIPHVPHKYQIEGDWLAYLLSLMRTDFNNFQKNNVQFITYNYDRVIETFFYETLKNSFGKNDAEVASVINNLKIIHLHGQLGYLPWQNAEETKKRAFGQGGKVYNELIDDINIGASEIKIIHEANPDSNEFIEAREILNKANSILFLGFGYAPQNIERLHLSIQHRNVQGTCLGLKDAEIQGIKRKYFENRASCKLFSIYNCLDLLRSVDRTTFND